MGEEHSTALSEARDLVAKLGGRLWRTHQEGQVRGDRGVPDAWFVCQRNEGKPHDPRPGKWVAAWYECKVTERDKMTPEQLGFKAIAELAGMPVVVGHPAAIADFLGY